ncbi:right-handed parallel beta-helix repeat-containing protein [Candidatus Woesearchaeota archaeon]|nr:right-handed parallel beta-helix repeat-containing protein [Candidatus Woesearchaeota archaeon]
MKKGGIDRRLVVALLAIAFALVLVLVPFKGLTGLQVADQPPLSADISYVVDGSLIVDLLQHFSDPEGQLLTFVVEDAAVVFDGSMLTFTSPVGFSGDYVVNVQVSDGVNTVYKPVTFVVQATGQPMADSPPLRGQLQTEPTAPVEIAPQPAAEQVSDFGVSAVTGVALNYPINNTNVINLQQAIAFNCSATSDTTLDNITLYHDFSSSFVADTTFSIGAASGGINTSRRLSSFLPRGLTKDRTFVWNCLACSGGSCSFAASNSTFSGWNLGSFGNTSHNASAFKIVLSSSNGLFENVSGVYTSKIFDAGAVTTWTNVAWDEISNNEWGTGLSGSLTVSSANTVVNTYTYLTGNEAAGDNVIAVNSGAGFSNGDEILIIQMQTSGGGTVGTYEFRTISSGGGTSSLTLNQSLTNSYNSGTFDSTAATVTQIVRVPHYSVLTVNGGASVVANTWNGFTGGIVVFRADNVTVQGSISVAGRGYRGSDAGSGVGSGKQGEGFTGKGAVSTSANNGGGGGGTGGSPNGGGGGGGNRVSGSSGSGTGPGAGGGTFGSAAETRLTMGGGGGVGGDIPGANDCCTAGANGGGIILVKAMRINVTGSISANGNAGAGGVIDGGPGGGAGGMVLLAANNITNTGSITATGGAGGSATAPGGAGGNGGIKIASSSFSGTSPSPAAELSVGFNSTDVRLRARACNATDCSDAGFGTQNTNGSTLLSLQGRYFQYQLSFDTSNVTITPHFSTRTINISFSSNTHPVIDQVILNSSDGSGETGNNASTDENLTVFIINATDADNEGVQNITDWRINGTSIAVLNMPFETNVSVTTAGAISDYSTFVNNGTLGNGTAGTSPVWARTNQGGAFVFDGVDDAIALGSDSSLQLSSFTIAAWTNRTGTGGVVASSFGGYAFYYQFGNFLCFGKVGTSEACTTATFGTGVSHVAVVYDGVTASFYVNGTLNQSVAYASPGFTTTAKAVGRRPDTAGNTFVGAIHEVLIFNRTLSAAQIYQLYSDGNRSKHLETIVSSELAVGNNWTVAVTPNDQQNESDGTVVLSNAVVIVSNTQPSISQVILNNSNGAGYNLNISNASSNLTVFVINATDADNEGVQNITDWRVNGSSMAVLNMPFESNLSVVTTGAVRDYSTSINNGTLGAGAAAQVPVWTTSGRVGGAYDFDGVNDFISVADSASLRPSGAFTVSAWINQDVNSTCDGTRDNFVPVGKITIGTQGYMFYEDCVGNTWTFFAYGLTPSTVTFNTTNMLGSWRHFVGVYNQTHLLAYVDGQLTGQTAVTGSVSHSANALQMGKYSTAANFYDGRVDEVAIFNTSLSSGQIYQTYLDGNSSRHVETMHANQIRRGDVWSVAVTPNDNEPNTDGTTVLSNNVTIINSHPEIDQVILNSTDGSGATGNNASTNENLTVFVINASDADNDSVQNITDWRINGTSIAVLNMPFETNVTTVISGAVRDYSTFGNNGTLGAGTAANAPVWNTSGKVGGYYIFDGSNDYINLGNVLDQSGSGPFSIHSWFKTTAGGAAVYTIASKELFSGSFAGYQVGMNVVTAGAGDAGKVGFVLVDGSTTVMRRQTTATFNDGAWHQVVVTYDGSKTRSGMSVYVDGALQAVTDHDSSSFAGSLSNAANFEMGARDGTNQPWSGSIDEVLMFNRTLSAQEINQSYLDGNSSKHLETIVSQELSVGQNWSVAVTPNDNQPNTDGTTKTSNSVTISANVDPSIAQVILNSTDGSGATGNNASTNENLTVFVINATDADSDSIQNITDWRVNGTSIAVLNMPFETNTASTARNYAPGGNNGSPTSISWMSTGKVGGAIDFDGSNSLMTVANTAAMNTGSFSVEFWFNPDQLRIQLLFHKVASCCACTNGWRIFMSGGTGTIEFDGCGEVANVNTGTTAAGTWNHLVATYDSITQNASIYLNGTLQASATGVDMQNTFANTLTFAPSEVARFDGKMDEFRMYDRSLSSQQVRQLYVDGNRSKHPETFVSQELRHGQNWSVAVTPNDNQNASDGSTVLSNNVTILNSDPSIAQVILNSTDGSGFTGNNASTSENLTVFVINATDADGDSIQNITDWRVNGNSIAVLNMPFETNVSSLVSGAVKSYASVSNNGTLGNGVSSASPVWNLSGRVGGAFTFDGGDNILIGSLVGFPASGNSALSFSGWFKTSDSSGDDLLLIMGDTAHTRGYHPYVSNSVFACGFGYPGGEVAGAGVNVADNAWHHFVCAVNSSKFQWIYLDGVLKNATQLTTSHTFFTEEIYVGSGATGSNFFTGTLDEVAIFNRTLTSAQAYRLYLDGNNSRHLESVVSNELLAGQAWSVAVTPNDNQPNTDGATVVSNNVTIVSANTAPSIAQVVLNSTDGSGYLGNNATTNENLTVFITNATDADNASVQNITDWRVNGTSVAVLNMPFETNSSSTATGAIRDYSAFTNNGTLGNGVSSNAPGWTSSGKVGGAYSFDGSNDFVRVPNSVSITPNLQGYSYEAWFKASSLPAFNRILWKNSGGAVFNGIYLMTSGSSAFFGIGDGTNVAQPNAPITANTWYHLVGVYDRSTSTAHLYVNGTLQASVTQSLGSVNYAGDLYIGSLDGGSEFFNGLIDEARIYNRSLSAAQVARLYNDSLNGNHPTTFVSQELHRGDVWSVAVTPNDNEPNTDGTTVLSNNVTILNSDPAIAQVILNSSDGSGALGNNASSSANLTVFVINATDADGDSVQNITDWRVNGTSIAVLNLPFETNSSSTAAGAIRDYSTFGNNGTLGAGTAANVPVWNSSGKVGGAYTFDGVDDYIDLGTPASLQITTLTAEAWVRRHGVGTSDGIVSSATNGWGFYFSPLNKLCIGMVGISEACSTGTITDTASLHHVAVTYDASTARFYFNGSLDSSVAYANPGFASAQKAVGGRPDTTSDAFAGTLDEVRVYGRVLSAQEVNQSFIDGNRSKHIETVVSNELSIGQNWSVAVTPNDNQNASDGTTVLSNNVTIVSANTDPFIGQVILNSTDGSGYLGNNATRDENLTVFVINASDSDNNSVQNITDWRVNGTSIAVLNLPFETNSSDVSSGAIRSYSTAGNNAQLGEGSSGAAPQWNGSGKVGGAYTFDGANDFIHVANNASLKPSTYSIAFWLRPDVITATGANLATIIVGTRDLDSVNNNFGAWIDFSAVGAFVRNNVGTITVVSESVPIQINVWTHYVITADGSTLRLYKNGSLNNSGAYANLQTNSQPIVIGERYFNSNNLGTFFDGTMDGIMIFNRTLSTAEVVQLYNDTNQGKHLSAIASAELRRSDVWSVAVTPNDNRPNTDGVTVLSNNVTIVNAHPSIAQVILNSTDGSGALGNNASTSENITVFVINASDADGDSVQNITDWRINSTSIAVLNLPFETNASSTVTGVVRDYSSFGNNGTLGNGIVANAPVWTASGRVGGAYTFDGVDDYVDFGDINALDGLSSLSISLWVKPISLSALKSLISKYSAATGNFFVGTAEFDMNDLVFAPTAIGGLDIGFTTGNFLDNNVWTQVVMVYDGSGIGNAGRLKAYINGSSVSLSFSGTIPGTLPSNSLPVLIGSASDGRYFNGVIDEVLIFNRSLSADQVYQLYVDGNRSRHLETISSSQLRRGDVWSVAVTPNDNQNASDGSIVLSNNVTILNADPAIAQVILNSTDGSGATANNASLRENLTVFVINATDADGDGVQNITDWRVNGTSIAVLNMPFETNTNSTALGAIRDYSSYGNNGTLGNGSVANAPVWNSSGRVGGAYVFDGTTDYIVTQQNTGISGNPSFSIETWLKTNTTSAAQCAVLAGDETVALAAAGLCINVVGAGGVSLEFAGGNGARTAGGIISANTMHHIVAVKTPGPISTTTSIYVDGVLQALSTSSANTPSITNLVAQIGWFGPAGLLYFNGTIDEVRIYNRTLTAAQVQQLFLDGNRSHHPETFVEQETSLGDNWSVAVTPNDNQNASDGSTVLSNNVTIVSANVAPSITQVILNSTDGSGASGNNASTSENLTVFIINATDANDDGVQNITDWRINGTSIAVLNMPFETNTSSTVSGAVRDYSQSGNGGQLGGGTAANAPAWTSAGKVGGAYSFDGVNDHVVVPDSDSLDIQNAIALEAWVNYDSLTSFDRIFGKYTGSCASPFRVYGLELASGNKFCLVLSDGTNDFGCLSSTTSISTGQWYHVVGTYDRSTKRIYVNGVLENQTSETRALGVNGQPVRIGGDPAGCSEFMDGTIDEARIYNRSLSAEQVYQLYLDGNRSRHLETIVSNELSVGQNWSVAVTPNDNQPNTDGATVLSNNVTILNSDPAIAQVILNSTDGSGATANNASTSENLTVFVINATDADNDAVQNITDWRVNGTSIAVLNMPFETNSSSTSSGAVRDYSQFGNNGTLGNGTAGTVPVWNLSGQVGGGYVFDGVNDMISLGDVVKTQLGFNYSVEAWIRPRTVSGLHAVVGYSTTLTEPNPFLLLLDQFNADVRFLVRDNALTVATATKSSALTANVWHHVVGVRAGNTVNVYVDGVNGTPATASLGAISVNNLKIGTIQDESGPDELFNGTIDEVRIYNRSLSAAQVYQLYLDGNRSRHLETIVSNELSVGQNWSVAVTPNDNQPNTDGSTVLSNNVTIISEAVCPLSITSSTMLTENVTCPATAVQVDSDNVMLDCAGNVVTYDTAGGGQDQGVLVSGRNNVTVRNCAIVDGNAGGAFGIGINVTNSNNNLFANNSLQTNGTNDNYGVLLQSGSSNVSLMNNTIGTNGTSSGIGIVVSSGSGIVVLNNTILTNSSSSNGIGIQATSMSSSAFGNNTINTGSTAGNTNIGVRFIGGSNNLVENNSIITNGSTLNHGLRLEGSTAGNVVRNNSIIARGSGSDNDGLRMVGATAHSIVNNNIVTVSAGGLGFGMFLASGANNNAIGSNTITTSGAGGSNWGIRLNTLNNLVENNTVRASGFSNDRGIAVQFSSTGNMVRNNTVVTTSGTGMSVETTSTNNFFDNNSIVAAGSGITVASSDNNVSRNVIRASGASVIGIAIGVGGGAATANSNNFTGNIINVSAGGLAGITIQGANFSNFTDTIISAPSWISSGVISSGPVTSNFTNTTFVTGNGSVRFPDLILLSGAQDVTQFKLNVTTNNSFVNSTSLSLFNTTAQVTLNGVPFTDPRPRVDFEDDGTFTNCNAPQCTEVSFAGGVYVFNVSSFTSYAASESAACPLNITTSTTLAENVTCPATAIQIQSNNVELDCAGFNVSYANSAAGNGIFVFQRSNVTVRNCNVVKTNASVVGSSGFLVQSTNNSRFVNNSATTNGAGSRGMLIVSVINSTFENNTGVGVSDEGIVVGSSTNNTLRGNTGRSTSGGYGLHVQSASANFLFGNTGNSSTSIGLRLNSATNNTLIENTGVSGSLAGIGLEGSSNNTLSGNNGTGLADARGISLSASSVNNTLIRNRGTSGSNRGMDLLSGSNNNILFHNTGLSNSGNGMELAGNNNTFYNNTFVIAITNTTGSAIDISGEGNNLANTSILGGQNAMRFTASSNNTFVNTTLVTGSTWVEVDATSQNNSFTRTLFHSNNGSILMINTAIIPVSTSIVHEPDNNNLNTSFNNSFLNSTNLTFLNTSAQITLRGLSFTDPRPRVDFNDDGVFEQCNPPQCIEVSYVGGVLVFNVSSFTSYAAGELGNITINVSKSDGSDPVNNGSTLSYNITINNTGTETAFNVTLVETYPGSVVFNGSQPVPSVGNNTWLLGNLSPGNSTTVNITVNVSAGASGTLNNTVNASFQNLSGGNGSVVVSELTTVNVTVVPPVPSPAPSGGGGGGATRATQNVSIPREFNMPAASFVTPYLNKFDRVVFDVAGERHVLTVLNVGVNNVLLRVQSEPQEFVLSSGQSKDVDVTDDGLPDLRVQVVMLFNNQVSLALAKLSPQTTNYPLQTTNYQPQTAGQPPIANGLVDRAVSTARDAADSVSVIGRSVAQKAREVDWKSVGYMLGAVLLVVLLAVVTFRAGQVAVRVPGVVRGKWAAYQARRAEQRRFVAREIPRVGLNAGRIDSLLHKYRKDLTGRLWKERVDAIARKPAPRDINYKLQTTSQLPLEKESGLVGRLLRRYRRDLSNDVLWKKPVKVDKLSQKPDVRGQVNAFDALDKDIGRVNKLLKVYERKLRKR